MEYKWLNHLYEAKSPFQHIEVIETLEHGKMLVLDADKNISEIDTESYTHMLMGLPEASLNLIIMIASSFWNVKFVNRRRLIMLVPKF